MAGRGARLAQCPGLDTHCPTCAQFRHLEEVVLLLQRQVGELAGRLAQAEGRVLELEAATRPCSATRPASSSWQSGCQDCTCIDNFVAPARNITDVTGNKMFGLFKREIT